MCRHDCLGLLYSVRNYLLFITPDFHTHLHIARMAEVVVHLHIARVADIE